MREKKLFLENKIKKLLRSKFLCLTQGCEVGIWTFKEFIFEIVSFFGGSEGRILQSDLTLKGSKLTGISHYSLLLTLSCSSTVFGFENKIDQLNIRTRE